MATTKAKQNSSTKSDNQNVVAMNSDISTQLETLKADVALLASTVKEQAQATVAEKTGTAKEIAVAKAEQAKDRYDAITQTAEQRIKENPLTSIALAVGAGLVLGAITRR